MIRLSAADFRKLRSSILTATLMIGIGAAAVHVARLTTANAQRAKLAVTAERNATDGKLKQVRAEESEIKQKSILFNTLHERGIIGEEQRLEWVELLKDIRVQRRLLDLRYELAPQRLLDSGPPGDFAFYASTMKLELKLLHEEDLTRLLGDLQQQAKALIRVNRCRVERLPPSVDERAGGHANLVAACEIDWLTVRDVSQKASQP
ncbi:MAG: hypothetical protein V5B32_11820 [Candidatus Accumulibacter sp. UW26]|jgi:hypothetical protein|uniref:hypothetical protein n=1 Tax=Candidatus Accumulibacter necessarius TaxID=2954386 RepID=UPI002FC34CDC